MARDPRNLDQNPVVIDPANVDAVLEDRPTKVTDPLAPPLDEVVDDASDEVDDQADESHRPAEKDRLADSTDGRPTERVIP